MKSVTTITVIGVSADRVRYILEMAERGHELYEMSGRWTVEENNPIEEGEDVREELH